ncbi:MAG: zinc ribbon domain-containing protein [Cyanobacteriota bacterium]|nr:zinc ribbon domain-containing protein [Cyanobacteriota bacterium]
MPLYEFKCNTCGPFDVWRAMAEATLPQDCPECQAPARRVFSAPMLLNAGRFPKPKGDSEPRLVQKQAEPAPVSTRVQSASTGRPWMINH